MEFDVHGRLDFAEPEVIRAEQTRLLNEHVTYCRARSPYYRRVLREHPDRPLTIESLAALPLTGKADLAEFNYKELCFGLDHFYGYPGRVQYNDALKAKGLDKVLEEDVACGPSIKKLLLSEKLSDYLVGMMGLTGVYFDGHTAMAITSALGKTTDHPELFQEYQAGLMAHQDVLALVMGAIASMQTMVADGQAVEALRPKVYGEGPTSRREIRPSACSTRSMSGTNRPGRIIMPAKARCPPLKTRRTTIWSFSWTR